jgi:hypothetical protein
MSTIFFDHLHPGAAARGWRSWVRRLPWTFWIVALAAAALLAHYELVPLLQSPGDEIRSELKSAASEMTAQILPDPNAAVLAAMRRDFHGQPVNIEAMGPRAQVAVTILGLDRQACLDAEMKTRRIEGPAVVTLEGYRLAEDCLGRNDMTWRIMP